jgi:hypothetical protein
MKFQCTCGSNTGHTNEAMCSANRQSTRQMMSRGFPELNRPLNVRYHAFLVADANCDSVSGPSLYGCDDLQIVKNYASNKVSTFGVTILDKSTGLYDFGFGFGVPVPEAAENE